MKPGVKTTEFWIASISAVVVAVMGILVGYKVLSGDQADLWIALAVAVTPAALAAISWGYGKSRATVKESVAWAIEKDEIWPRIAGKTEKTED